MAKLRLVGKRVQVQLDRNDEGQVVARCIVHQAAPGETRRGTCRWTEIYDDMNDAVEYAADHADRG